MKILISGASIAGPALALSLGRYGHDVTVVELAAGLRPGGQAVDFKGAVHDRVLRELGIRDEVYARQTGKTDLEIVDARGRKKAVIPGEFIGGDVEIARGDLAAILYERTKDTTRYIFDDRITELAQRDDRVDVVFARSAAESFDLIVGADGIHSAVRRLAFGPEVEFVEFLGYYYAVVGASEHSDQRAHGIGYNEPGRLVWTGGQKAAQLYVFASSERGHDRDDEVKQRELLRHNFAGAGWRVPELLEQMSATPEFYLDSFGRVTMDGYTRGRVALVGDSAYGNTLGGFGTGLAIVGAYVLAGELARADGDHRVAFACYDDLMRRYSKVIRKASAGPFLAPASKARITLRNWTFKASPLFLLMMKLTDRFATDIELPPYPSA
ncbi:FAD-dependent oxidoreductase [Gordonia sp. TBRC 11910]|uniref:FAD-dependent oxidoreductase n=1 Tax=Gordonia asplenii TaxID=2725283 RepID=A0A848KWV7_9ACTN|nr:FAD-dependent monooxygenase [Gordonia asplenii]NMO02557.1 FAD-dependent oxidoreductase [Gordonia asplenii]